MARLNIDFVLIDETVVMNGFRCLMSGAQLAGFIANPVMLCHHVRPDDEKKEAVVLPIGKWYDIRIEGDKLLAKPDFDDADPFAMQIQGKVERGYMNGASIWLEPLAASNDSKLKLAGQKLPTVTKWGVLEASIVDIPNCRTALAMREPNGSIAKLSATTDADIKDYLKKLLPTTKNTDNMSLLKLAAQKLALPEDSAEDVVLEKLAAVIAENATVTKLKTDKEAAEAKIKQLEDAATAAKIENLVDKAISDKKLAAGERANYIKLAAADFDTTAQVLNAMKPYESVEQKMQGAGLDDAKTKRLGELMKLSYDELLNSDQLEELKKIDEPSFKLKANEAGIKF